MFLLKKIKEKDHPNLQASLILLEIKSKMPLIKRMLAVEEQMNTKCIKIHLENLHRIKMMKTQDTKMFSSMMNLPRICLDLKDKKHLQEVKVLSQYFLINIIMKCSYKISRCLSSPKNNNCRCLYKELRMEYKLRFPDLNHLVLHNKLRCNTFSCKLNE